MTIQDTETIMETLAGLKARAHKLSAVHRSSVYFEIARLRMVEIERYAVSEPEHATNCCWEARAFLNKAEGAEWVNLRDCPE